MSGMISRRAFEAAQFAKSRAKGDIIELCDCAPQARSPRAHGARAPSDTARSRRVVVPAGRFLTGAIRLESGVNLHLTRNATLAFSRDAKDYLPVVFTRWEGVELMNYSPFIYAFDAENIAVTGPGTLDGQAGADAWWNWRGTGPSGGAQSSVRNAGAGRSSRRSRIR